MVKTIGPNEYRTNSQRFSSKSSCESLIYSFCIHNSTNRAQEDVDGTARLNLSHADARPMVPAIASVTCYPRLILLCILAVHLVTDGTCISSCCGRCVSRCFGLLPLCLQPGRCQSARRCMAKPPSGLCDQQQLLPCLLHNTLCGGAIPLTCNSALKLKAGIPRDCAGGYK